jgi:hypothetical protein
MSHDLEHRDSPPDFGGGDDDDQMFKSASLPVTDDVRLSEDDDDDENPFGEIIETKKIPLTIPPVTPIAVPEPQPPTPVKQETQFFPSDSTEKNTSITQPIHSTPSFESQLSPSKPIANEYINITTNAKPIPKRSAEHNIEIIVSDPTKIGEVWLLFILNIVFKF